MHTAFDLCGQEDRGRPVAVQATLDQLQFGLTAGKQRMTLLQLFRQAIRFFLPAATQIGLPQKLSELQQAAFQRINEVFQHVAAPKHKGNMTPRKAKGKRQKVKANAFFLPFAYYLLPFSFGRPEMAPLPYSLATSPSLGPL
jgi:hypothetical protein